MAFPWAAATICLLGAAAGQQAGMVQVEEHPSLTMYGCSITEACMPQRGGVTLDAQYRWLHAADSDGAKSCMSNGKWDKDICPDAKTCAENCAVEGLDVDSYKHTYGISRVDNGFKLEYSSNGGGSRVHVTDALNSYKVFNLKNREISFDVDLSNLPCGVSSSITLTPMDSEGEKGMGENTAGALYGLGRCDANCTRSVKFIRGKANLDGWDAASGTGEYGSCCPELRLFDADQESTSMSVHACASAEPEKCKGSDCSQKCDAVGCSFDPAELGNKDFFGPGAAVDTEKPITVVTQFITADGTDTGALSEVRRYYVQSGKTISNARAAPKQFAGSNSITDAFCGVQKEANGSGGAAADGYLGRISAVLSRGVVLSASILESDASGSCGGGSLPKKSSVVFSNFMHGEIATTCPECLGDDDEDSGAQTAGVPVSNAKASPALDKAVPKPFVQTTMFKYIMGGVGAVVGVILLSTCCTSQRSSGWTVTGQGTPVRGGSSRRLQ